MTDLEDCTVVFVPGFLAQLYEATSKHVNALSTQGLIDAARKIPLIGDQVASLIPTLGFPVDPKSLVSFADQENAFRASGAKYVDMGKVPGFDTQGPVAGNSAAIRDVVAKVEADGRPSLIVSHSKGGLDTLDALIQANDGQRASVRGWLSIQAPFFGSPLADAGSGALNALGLDMAALRDLSVSVRSAYMSAHAHDVAALVGDVPVTCAFSTYQASPANALAQAALALAKSVIDPTVLVDITKIVASNLWEYGPLAAGAHDVSDVISLIAARRNQAIKNVMGNFGAMDLTNPFFSTPNDGLVPELSAQLPGATPFRLTPDTDHAGPVMSVTPFKNFWTPEDRVRVTKEQLTALLGRASSGKTPLRAAGDASR